MAKQGKTTDQSHEMGGTVWPCEGKETERPTEEKI